MGFSVSGSAAIIFLAAFVCFGILYTTAYNSFERFDAAQDERAEQLLEQRNTEVEIVDVDTTNSNYLNVTVNNTGSTTLHVNETDILFNGTYQVPEQTSVDGQADATLWHSGETLRMNVSYSTGTPVRVKLITETGIAAFREVT